MAVYNLWNCHFPNGDPMVRRGDRREKRFLAVPIINGCLHVIDEIPILIDVSCQKNARPHGLVSDTAGSLPLMLGNLVCNCQGPLRCLQVQL